MSAVACLLAVRFGEEVGSEAEIGGEEGFKELERNV